MQAKAPGNMVDLFRQTNQQWLSDARHEAQRLLMNRQVITIEHVLQVCPFPSYLKRNLIGQVFKDPIFRPLEFTRATRAVCRGHVIRRWTLNEEYSTRSQLNWRSRRRMEYENE